jgi:hypothetical protein
MSAGASLTAFVLVILALVGGGGELPVALQLALYASALVPWQPASIHPPVGSSSTPRRR